MTSVGQKYVIKYSYDVCFITQELKACLQKLVNRVLHSGSITVHCQCMPN